MASNVRFTSLTVLAVLIEVLFWILAASFDPNSRLKLAATYIYGCDTKNPVVVPRFQKLFAELDAPGAQFVFINGIGEVSVCNFGFSSKGILPNKVTSVDVFRYASISKIFTSLSIVKAGDEVLNSSLVDLLQVDTTKNKDLRYVRVQHLLQHTGGFDRSVTVEPLLQKRWCAILVQNLKDIQLDFPPGSRFSYSNIGYCLLGAVLEDVSGESLEEIFKRDIFDKTADARILPVYSSPRGDLAARYGSYSDVQLDAKVDYDSLLAVGSWAGSAKSLALILRAVVSESVIISELQKKMVFHNGERCQDTDWRACHGFTFYRYERAGRSPMWWRDGSLPGAIAFAGIFGDGSIVVALGNSRNANSQGELDRLGLDIYQMFSPHE